MKCPLEMWGITLKFGVHINHHKARLPSRPGVLVWAKRGVRLYSNQKEKSSKGPYAELKRVFQWSKKCSQLFHNVSLQAMRRENILNHNVFERIFV